MFDDNLVLRCTWHSSWFIGFTMNVTPQLTSIRMTMKNVAVDFYIQNWNGFFIWRQILKENIALHQQLEIVLRKEIFCVQTGSYAWFKATLCNLTIFTRLHFVVHFDFRIFYSNPVRMTVNERFEGRLCCLTHTVGLGMAQPKIWVYIICTWNSKF